MKVLSVVGARPQLIKAAAVSRVLRERHREVLVHTGQHYDRNMSDLFFEELAIPLPDYNLGVGSATQAAQTAAMLIGLEQIAIDERPDWILVYGDTNSTLAGSLAAAKLLIPIAHVEAGLRSFDRRMPEEVNRVVTDHLSALLLCPSRQATENLAVEGITAGVRIVGDVMLDAFQDALGRAVQTSTILKRVELTPGGYLLATVHRAENTDDPARLRAIIDALGRTGEPVVLPLHPRTRKVLDQVVTDLPSGVRLIDPVGYLDMLVLEKSSRLILTDSGGVQKEAYWLGVPCITLRDQTEWVETVDAGWNVLVGAKTDRILAAVSGFSPPANRPELYGQPGAALRCVREIEAAALSPQ